MNTRKASRSPIAPTASVGARSVLMASAAAIALLGLPAAPAFAQSAAPPHAVDRNALPQNPNVVRGQAGFATDGSRLDVNQSTDRVVIDWRSFDIGKDAGVSFHQPGTDSIAVNRISGGGMPSQIDGMLNANGTVVILNPNGVLFSASSTVNVGGLVASTGKLDIDRFMAGDNRLAFTGATSGSVTTLGTINIADAGLAAFVAPHVRNDGVINARLGRVALAAGETFTLDLAGDRLIEIGLGAHTPLVENYGSILVDGGRVQLSAAAAGAVVDQVINSGGLVSVASARQDGGAIVLEAVGGGVTVGGELNASGATGGGEISITGATIASTADAVLNADATGAGDGGSIVATADGRGDYAGTFSARGGAAGGDGGFVETSGRTVGLDAGLVVDASAAEGRSGGWLIDPVDLVVDAGEAAAVVNNLATGDVILQAENSITVNSAIDSSAQANAHTLSLNDEGGASGLTVNLNAGVRLGAGQRLTGQASQVNIRNGGVIQNGVDVALAGASIDIEAGDYAGGTIINKDGLTLTSSSGAKIVIPALASGDMNGLTVNADGVTIQGLEIAGPADESWLTYGWNDAGQSGTTRGIAVWNGADNFTIQNNNIHGVRNGVLIDGRNTGSLTGNTIDNTKSAISVQYTDAGLLNVEGFAVDISGNSEGQYGNEWGLNFHLNGHQTPGGLVGNAVKIAATASEAVQAALLAVSAANDGMSAQDQGYNFSNRTSVNVGVGGNDANQGSALGQMATIQAGVKAVVSGGLVNVGAGTFVLGSTLSVDGVSLIGAGSGLTTIDASGVTAYGLYVTGDGVTLSGFDFKGPTRTGQHTYAIKVQAEGGTGARMLHFTASDLNIDGSYRTGLDLNGVVDGLIDGVTVTNTASGNGIAITDSANVRITNSTTSRNTWGGLALYQENNAFDQQVRDITVDASNRFDEAAGLYMQDSSALHDIGALTIEGFDHIVHESATSTVFQRTLSDAQAFALTKAAGSSIEGWTGTGGSNAFSVINGLQINNAVRDARSGGVISIQAGDYSESASLGGRTYGLLIAKDNLTLQGVDASGDVITDARDVGAWITALASASFGAHHYVTGSNVTIQGLGFAPMAGSSGKTVEVTGDAFTLRNSVIDNTGSRADINLYISGFTNNSGAPWSTVERFKIQDNIFTSGDLGQKIVVVGAGVGLSADASQRLVSGNIFNGNGQADESGVHVQGLISSQAWQARKAGAVTIADNTFNDVALAVRSVGGLVDGLDWDAIFKGNTFTGGAVLTYVGNTDQARAGTLTLGGVDVDDTFISRTIQTGVNQALTGDTVRVAAGDYADQNVVINKSLSLLGANAGVHAATGDGAAAPGDRGAESVLTGSGPYVFRVTAKDVTIDGFTFTGGGGRLVETSGTANGFRLVNNIFDAPGGHAGNGLIYLTGTTKDALIANNLFAGQGGAGFLWASGGAGDGLHGLTVSGNDFTGVSDRGLFQGGQPFSDFHLDGNYFGSGIVTGVNMGHLINPLIENNRFMGVAYAAMQIGTYSGGVIRNNVLDGTGVGYDMGGYEMALGIQIWGGAYNTPTSPGLVIEGNKVVNYQASGLNPADIFAGVFLSADAGPNIVFRNNTLTDNSIGLSSSSAAANLQLLGNTISTGADGIAIRNVGAATIDLAGGANTINGVDVDEATLAELFEIEDRIAHRIDNAAYGFVNLRDGQLFATATAGNLGRAVGLATAGDTVNVANGVHTLSSTLEFFADGVSLIGQSRAGAIIDASGAATYGIRVHADDVSLSGFTLSGGSGYGVKVETGGAFTPDLRRRGFSIADVTIQNTGRTGLDLNAVVGAVIDGVTVTGVASGNGVSITDSADVRVTNSATSGNAWGGLALYQRNSAVGGSDQKLTDITIGAGNSFGEANGVYAQDESALHDFGALNIQGYDFTVRNAEHRSDGAQFTYFQKTLQDAFNFAVALASADASYVEGWDGSHDTGAFHVGVGDAGAGARSLSLQTAFDKSGEDDAIFVETGRYAETATLDGRRALSFDAVEIDGLALTADAAGTRLSGEVIAGSGGLDFAGAVMLTGDAALTVRGGDIALAGVDAAQAGGAALAVDGDGLVRLGAVGGQAALSGLTVAGASISATGAVTTGDQSFSGAAIRLAGDYRTSGGDFSAGATTLTGDVSVSTHGGDAVLGAVDGAHALSVAAGGGDVALGAVGGATALDSLSVSGDAIVTDGARTTGGQTYAATRVGLSGAYDAAGGFTVGGATTLDGAVSIASHGGDIVLEAVDGAHALTVDAGDGEAWLGAVGSRTALAGLSAKGGRINAAGARTSGGQSFTAADIRLTGAYATNGGGFSLIGLSRLDGPTTIATGGGTATLGRIQSTSAFDLDVGRGDASLDSIVSAGAVTIRGGRVVLTGDAYSGASLSFLDAPGSTVRLTRALTTFNTSRPSGQGGNILFQPNLIGTTDGAQSVAFIAGGGRSSALDGDVTLQNAGTEALRLGAMTVTGGDLSAQTVKLAGDYGSTLSGDQVFSAHTLDTLGNVNANVAGNDVGPIIAGGSVTIVSGGSSAGALSAGGAVNINSGGDTNRVITANGPVVLVSGGGIGGSITSGGDVSLGAAGPIVLSVTTPGALTVNSNSAVNLTVDAGAVTVNAPGGTIVGSFSQITTGGGAVYTINGQTVIGDTDADIRQYLISQFLAPLGGVVGADGEIRLPANLAIGLIAPAGEGQGNRLPIVVNSIERLGELLRLGYTAIIVELDQNAPYEQELDIAVEGEGQPVG